MSHCLDSWAILAWLDGDEPAASIVDDIILRERPAVSWINLVEVDYRLRRDHGPDDAARSLEDVRRLVAEELPGIVRMRAVAAIKAEHPIALADCFALATATASNATLVTGDPEILDCASHLGCELLDAR